MSLSQGSSGSRELREEARSTLAARRELGPELDDQLVESFAQRIQGIIQEEVARQVGTRPSQTTKQILDWRKDMYAITLGCGIPILVIAAIVGGAEVFVAVCVILAIVAVAVTSRSQ